MATGSNKGGSKQRSTKPRSASSRSSDGSSSSKARSNGKVTAAKVVRHAQQQMQELTSQPVEGVRGVRRDDDGGWEVVVEVLELRRIPESTDVLGSYFMRLDENGEVTEFRRVRRYHRNAVEED
jgi:hypothetical protein